MAAYSGKESEYTAASWAKFNPAFTEADRVAKSEGPGQEELDAAKSGLEAVVAKLDKKADAAAVADLKEAVASYKKAEYTAESWKKFEYVLEEVKEIANSEDPGEKMVSAAKTSLETAKLKLVKTASSESSNKLNASVENADRNYKESDYTEESWAEFSQALQTAKEILSSGAADQELVDAVQSMLDAAIRELVRKQPGGSDNKPAVDKTKLAASVNSAKTYKPEGYTTASWTAFTTALSAAQGVLDNKDASQAQVDAADNNLKSAISKLEKVKIIKKKATVGLKEKYSVKTSNCTYITSNNKVAAVNSKGIVSTKKKGTVTIKAINKNGKEVTEYRITVKKAPTKITKVTPAKKTLKKGKSCKLKVTLPKGSASNKITFTSSKRKVATVSSKGVVKAKKKGTTVITVKTFNKKTKKVKITVK